MANTFYRLGTVTVGSGGSTTIVFSNIPQTYTDLCLFYSVRDVSSGSRYTDVAVTVNSQSSAYTTVVYSVGNISQSGSYQPSTNALSVAGTTSTASVFSNNMLYFTNYTSTGYKSSSNNTTAENNANGYLDFALAMGDSTIANGAAITSLTLTSATSNGFQQYSTAFLYGIKNS